MRKLRTFLIALALTVANAAGAFAGDVVYLKGGCGSGNLAEYGNPYLTVDGQGRNCVGDYFAYSNIASNATTTVKSGAGVLHSITINTKGATANTATVYDNTAASGTKIATIDTTSAVGTVLYDVAFSTGLTIVTASRNGCGYDCFVQVSVLRICRLAGKGVPDKESAARR